MGEADYNIAYERLQRESPEHDTDQGNMQPVKKILLGGEKKRKQL